MAPIHRTAGTTAAIALMLPAAFCVPAIAEDVKVLSDNDIGHAGDMATPGRWGRPVTDGGRTSRTYPGPRSLSYVGIKPWFDGKAPEADAMVRITYRDTTNRSAGVLVWNGAGPTYGYNPIGRIGGTNDGQWKHPCLLCPRNLIRRRPGQKPENVCWMLFNGGGRIDVDRIEFLAPSPALLAKSVADARAARARSIESLLKTFKHVPWKDATPLGEVSPAFQARSSAAPSTSRSRARPRPATTCCATTSSSRPRQPPRSSASS